MERNSITYNNYIELLKSELLKAMGCTEPISLAYCAAKAKEVLGEDVIKVEVLVSANIIKNVKSVIVPNTGGLKGIKAAVACGILEGKAGKKLQVISECSCNSKDSILKFIDNIPIKVSKSDSDHIFDIYVKVYSKDHSASVRIIDSHTNIVSVKYDSNPIEFFKSDLSCVSDDINNNLKEFKENMTIDSIYDFATTCNILDIKDIIDTEIECNMAIANEGIKNSYGANIGKTLLLTYGNSTLIKARAYAAAASDARMNGCSLPVVINSGSGNQGITCSVPVIIYANDLGVSSDTLYRALLISNLTTLHIKQDIGCLSAYCGAVAAGAAAGAGICYLNGGDLKGINHTIVNSLGIASGIICDGAKSSCAAKISSSVDAGIMGYMMYKNGNQFKGGDGIIKKGVENTIHSVGKLASKGMLKTDEEIIKIMLDEE